jgi:predicted DNA-binding transcriptional regulator YafY
MRIDRLLAITVLLLKQERVTARDLAERFEVSIRTIYRDMDAMCLAGIPVLPYPGNGGGYRLMDNYKLDKRLLKPEDIQAILSTLSGMNRTLGDGTMQSTIDKISSLLPRGTGPNEPSFCEQLVIDLYPWDQNPLRVDKIRLIHRGITRSQCLRFVYQNAKAEAGEREIEPMTLVFKGYSWYLFAFCLQRSDYRFFKISRMTDIQLTERVFQRRPEGYETHLPGEKRLEEMDPLVLDFKAEMKPHLEDTFHQAPQEILENGDIRLRLKVPREEWVLGMILSYGPMVRVVSPASIRAQLVTAAEKIIGLYQI